LKVKRKAQKQNLLGNPVLNPKSHTREVVAQKKRTEKVSENVGVVQKRKRKIRNTHKKIIHNGILVLKKIWNQKEFIRDLFCFRILGFVL